MPEGYTANQCGDGYTQIDTFVSGNDTYYKCEANKCEGYDYTECGVGYDKTQSCLSGTDTYYKCTPKTVPSGYTTNQCGNGYTLKDTLISGTTPYYLCEEADCSQYATDCGEGYNKTQSCLSGSTPYYTCTPKNVPEGYSATPCGEGYVLKNTIISGITPYYLCEANSCSGFDYTQCPIGYVPSATCLSGETTKYKCENCATGYVKNGTNKCVIGSQEAINNTVISIDNDDKDTYGMLYQAKQLETAYIYNAKSDETNKEAEGTIHIKHSGDGNVYGIATFSNGNSLYSAHVYNAYANSNTEKAKGTIKIDNTGDGNVTAIQGLSNTNYRTYNSLGNAVGIIDVINKGNGNVTGIIGGNTKNGQNDIIRIDNVGHGDVIGMSGGTNQGIIDIDNVGNGNVIGKPIYNSGNINIKNTGNGDIKGAGGTNNGSITIVNNGLGNTYGLYAPDGRNVYNVGTQDGNTIIEIVNQSDGVAVGMYSKSGTIENSNDIIIHNLGEGTAIGLLDTADYKYNYEYSGEYSGEYRYGGQIINKGNITINRDTYIDEDGIVYKADTDRGGRAIGIYGGPKTIITNSETGIIRINGAETAYGIWSEGSNVINQGTILIDGSYTLNAIRLYGGTLFQDGILQVATSWNTGKIYNLLGEISKTSSTEEIYGFYLNEEIPNTEIMNAFSINNSEHNGKIILSQQSNKNSYGIFSSYVPVYNSYAGGNNSKTTATINISNVGDGDVYGIKGRYETYNAYTNGENTGNETSVTSSGKILIENRGNGNAYGMFSNTVHNAYNYEIAGKGAGISSETDGYIKIKNYRNGSAYGMYGTSAYNTYTTIQYNTSNSASKDKISQTANGNIEILNLGHGNAYGIYAEGTETHSGIADNMSTSSTSGWKYKDTSSITLVNKFDGNATGIYAKGYITNNGNIIVHNLGEGVAVGINVDYHTDGADATNNDAMIFISQKRERGKIVINRDNYNEIVDGNTILHKATSAKGGTSIGILASSDTMAHNYGDIQISDADIAIGILGKSKSRIDVDKLGIINIDNSNTAIGIYAENGTSEKNTTVTNSGTITITNSTNAYGIYAEGENVEVSNTGTISINGTSCTGTNCGSANNAIVLNGGKLFQDGALIVTNNTQNSPMSVASVKPASLNLNDFGGTVVAFDTSQFVVEGAISGDLAINNSVIENGFDTTYSVKDMIQAGDASELNLVSQSALFDATLENNTDAVMTMKAFNDVVENGSVADFLQANYTANNNEELFKTLKATASVAELNNNIDDLFGKNMLSRMAFEDLSMLREVSLDMKNHLFKQEGAFAFGGNVSPSSYDNNIGSVGRYSLNGFNNGKMSFGVGVSITDVRTDDGNSDNRRFDRNFMMSAPVGYKTHGFELITAPKMGYADGTYDRDGFNNMTYEGKVQKRMFALMNEARYPVKFSGLKLIPSAEFNMIGYNIKGHEDEKEYSLRIKSQNHYSVEAGLGLMAEKEFKPYKNHKFNVSGGVAVYHEFADPYELDVAMNGMSGTYRLHDKKRSDNRAAIRFGFGYELKDYIDVTANLLTNIDREYRTDASIDMKYHF